MSAKSSLPHEPDKHPFGVLLTQHRRRRRGLTQTHLAELSGYHPAILVRMCQGKKDLTGPSGRERVVRLIEVLRAEGALHTVDEANALLAAAELPPLYDGLPLEATLIHLLRPSDISKTNMISGIMPSPTPSPTRHLPPIPMTNLIGREEDVSTLCQLLQSHRCVTLTGAGGSGKTSLALAIGQSVATQYAHGVCFVSLAAIQHEEFVPGTIAECLNVPNRPNLSILDNIKHYLRDKQLLLILDNFGSLGVAVKAEQTC